MIDAGRVPSFILWGPPGVGKTTLAQIIANKLDAPFYTLSAISSGVKDVREGIEKAKSNRFFNTVSPILFIDEIHRLNRQVEEVLYPAMEDFAIDIMIGKGQTARSIRLDLPHFTLVGATTRAGLLTAPLRDRFGVVNRLEYYTIDELKNIIISSAGVLKAPIDKDGATELARRSRGTPRLANRLLKRVRDFAQVKYDGIITREVVDYSLDLLDVDKEGLDKIDRNIAVTMFE